MKHLFSTFQIKNCRLNNRIVMPGLASFLIEGDGVITDKAIEHYRLRAAGGAAMVIAEACAVSPEGIVSPHQARIYDDRFTEGLHKIARAMKAEGSIPAVQIHHGGRQTSAKVIKQMPVAPSPLPCPAISGDVKPLSVGEIQELVGKFGDAAERAVAAGFELIEIHGAHGYLINQFLSAFSNIREDAYGGDLAGRTRFAEEIVKEVRRRVGDGFPISFKISAMEFVRDGITVEASIDMLKILVKAGIDVVQVSAGNDATPEWICQPMFMDKACLSGYAGAIKNALKIPTMAVGRINDPLVAENIIESMTRKLFMERMREKHVVFMTETSLARVEDKCVVVKDREGNERVLDAERVVVTVGNKPENRLLEQLRPLGFEIHLIGDCLEPRSAKAAIYEGAVLGRAL